MKKMKFLTLLAASSVLALMGCSGGGDDSSSATSTTSGGIPEGYVRVYFYVDFTQPDTGEYLSYQDVLPGSKVTKPENPTPVHEDFPNFLGWSYKEVIKDTSDLWNFDTNTIQVEEGANTFAIYAIWDA